MTDSHMAVAAQALTGLGWRVMPIKPQGKEPLTRHGVKDATTDEKVIVRWFKRWPDANLAIATGAPGPQVLDIDDPHAAGQLLPQLRQIHPPTVAAVRGPHLYFAGTPLATVSLGFGELRGVGSYILVPPSIHPSGKEYVWIDSPNGPLPEFPAVLLPHQRTAGTGDFDAPDLIPVGQRHDALKDAAVRFLRGGFTDAATIEQMLKSFFEMRCDPNPPPRKDEFSKIAHWAATSDMAERERNSKPLLDVEDSKGKSSKKKQSKLDKAPGANATLAEHRAYLQLAAGLPDAVEITTAVRYGGRGINRLKFELSNGQQVIFDRQELVATRGQWARTVVMHTNGIANPPNLTDWQSLQALRSLCVLADAPPEIRENEDIDDHVNELEAMTERNDDHDLDEQDGRFNATAHLHARGSWEPRSSSPERPVLLISKNGKRYVRAGELLAFLNWRGFSIAPSDLEAKMRGIGLTRHVLLGREGQRLDGKRRRTNRMVVYELPAESE